MITWRSQQLPPPTFIPGQAPPPRVGAREEGWNGRWPDRTASRTQDAIAGRQLARLPGQVFAAARLAFLSLSLISFHKLLTCTGRLRSCCGTRLSAARLALSARTQTIRDAQRDSGARGPASIGDWHVPGALPSSGVPTEDRTQALRQLGSRQAPDPTQPQFPHLKNEGTEPRELQELLSIIPIH